MFSDDLARVALKSVIIGGVTALIQGLVRFAWEKPMRVSDLVIVFMICVVITFPSDGYLRLWSARRRAAEDARREASDRLRMS